jgi:hypothetical protein
MSARISPKDKGRVSSHVLVSKLSTFFKSSKLSAKWGFSMFLVFKAVCGSLCTVKTQTYESQQEAMF